MAYEVICKRGCGFRVRDSYYREKPRFTPGICARCNGPVLVVEPYTEDVVGFHIETNPNNQLYRQVVPNNPV